DPLPRTPNPNKDTKLGVLRRAWCPRSEAEAEAFRTAEPLRQVPRQPAVEVARRIVQADDLGGDAVLGVLVPDGGEGGDGRGDRDMSMTTREGSSAYENCVVRSFELAKNSSPSTAYRATDPSSDSVRATVVKCATRRTKRTAAVRIPAPTPTARFSVSTVSATVTSITAVSLFGMRRSVEGRTECQSNAAYDTMSMTATSAAMGIDATKSPNTITSTRRKAPARNVEMRVRAPEILTFIMVCPTTAQPPMPPN